MQGFRLLAAAVLLAFALILAAAPSPAPAGSAEWQSCKSVKDIGPTGMDPADGWKIRALRISCKKARRVVRSYTRAAFEQYGKEWVEVRGFLCTNSYPKVRCKRGDRRIRFRNDG